jgi:hypothetical protein
VTTLILVAGRGPAVPKVGQRLLGVALELQKSSIRYMLLWLQPQVVAAQRQASQ